MSTSSVSQRARRGALRLRPSRRSRELALACEPLEPRHLLSTGVVPPHAAPAAGAVPALVVIQFNAPSFSGFTGSGSGGFLAFQIQIGFGPAPQTGIGLLSGPISFSTTGELPSSSVTNEPTPGGESGQIAAALQDVTPLTAVILSGPSNNGRSVGVVIVAPQVIVANLGPSTAPVTTQAILTTVMNEEGPAISTHFGQGALVETVKLPMVRPVAVKPWSPAMFDVIEPMVPEAIDAAPNGQTAPAPAAAAFSVPAPAQPEIMTALDLPNWGLVPVSPWHDASRFAQRSETRGAYFVPSTSMFSVAAVAMAGYQLALWQADRFRGRAASFRSTIGRSASML